MRVRFFYAKFVLCSIIAELQWAIRGIQVSEIHQLSLCDSVVKGQGNSVPLWGLGQSPNVPPYFASASYTAVTLAVTLMLPERMPVSADSARMLTAPLSATLLTA